jgi:hypothetical protein
LDPVLKLIEVGGDAFCGLIDGFHSGQGGLRGLPSLFCEGCRLRARRFDIVGRRGDLFDRSAQVRDLVGDALHLFGLIVRNLVDLLCAF